MLSAVHLHLRTLLDSQKLLVRSTICVAKTSARNLEASDIASLFEPSHKPQHHQTSLASAVSGVTHVNAVTNGQHSQALDPLDAHITCHFLTSNISHTLTSIVTM